MNCYFRTHISNNTGIGNYIRCLRLAISLKKKGHKCTIFIDNKINNKIFNKNIKHVYLYNSKKKFSESLDSRIFNEKTDKKGFVFVDDYRLNKIWQTQVKRKHQKIIVIDDFSDKKIIADILINTKPDFLIQSNYEKETIRNKNSKLLLGPKYAIIDNKKDNYFKKKNSLYRICFYFGGSGNLNLPIKIIKNLVHKVNLKKVQINIVVGPFSKNKNKLLKLQNKYKKIKVLKPSSNLSRKFKNFDLFIGSAGISLFETALYNIPSIIFVINDNQKVDTNSLEKLGHYFVLNKNDLKKVSKISDIIILFSKNKQRINKLITNREFNIDEKGSDRIVKEVFSKNKSTPKFEYIYGRNILKSEKKLKIEKTQDKEINIYRQTRNNLINRKFSLNNSVIEKVDHYNWWFKNNRESYSVKKNNKTLMYFFHDIFKINNYTFLIPGWYILNKQISFLDIMQGITKQYKILINNKKFKNVFQIGIINKKNKSMINLAPKLNWRLIDKNDSILKVLKTRIKIKNFFNYYRR